MYLVARMRKVELLPVRERVNGGIASFSLASPCAQQEGEASYCRMHSTSCFHLLLLRQFLDLPQNLFSSDFFTSYHLLCYSRLLLSALCSSYNFDHLFFVFFKGKKKSSFFIYQKKKGSFFSLYKNKNGIKIFLYSK